MQANPRTRSFRQPQQPIDLQHERNQRKNANQTAKFIKPPRPQAVLKARPHQETPSTVTLFSPANAMIL